MVDTVNIPATVEEEDPNHVAEMLAKVDKANEAPTEELPVDEERPGWLPEKFKSPEDLAKAYSELESKLGKPQQNTEQPTAETPEEQVQEELQNKGLDLNEFSQEFTSKGELSTDSYEKLEKARYPRDIVDQYIEGQKARASLFESEVKAVAGGDQGFAEMIEWAKSNMSPAEIEAYNAAIDSNNPNQAKLAVSGMYQRFQNARPTEPQLMSGRTTGATSGEVYDSVAQLTKDMSSVEYKTDPAFRAKVQSKLSRSNIL